MFRRWIPEDSCGKSAGEGFGSVRYGIISDIHGNLEALHAVLAALRDMDEIVCLGDIVGYGPDPDECCQKVMHQCTVILVGNHDRAAVHPEEALTFNNDARDAALWTADHIAPKTRMFLSTLPTTALLGCEVLLVHGAPSDPDLYVASLFDATDEFPAMDRPICFYGHTHIPEAYLLREGEILPERLDIHPGKPVTLEAKTKYLINVGSVGQPRDGDWRAACGVYDEAKGTVEIRRVPYPVQDTAAKIARVGLPVSLAERLEVGG